MAKSGKTGNVTQNVIPKYSRDKYSKVSKKDRDDVLKRDKDCVYCEKKPSKTVDHVKSQKRDWNAGGHKDSKAARSARVNNPKNLAGACTSCNPSKGSRELGTEWIPPKDR